MKWNAENFPKEMEILNPRTRDKAIELLNTLMGSNIYSEQEAIALAIQQAEEWFYEAEG
ncbi:hypothetical protein WG906_00370 [Pedobacter sp. P351]|uniref:hypothetical protein n=1 Tax=Pedobacter superstes TaxID=3133441 RepID=UPI003094F44C